MDGAENITILIAEDNVVSRELMASILKTQGYQIMGASDGTQAIQVIENNDIDLALVDLNMAPTGGFEFVRYLVVNGIRLPVIVVTADESTDVLMKANELNVTRILQKPVEPDRLLSIVGHVLKKYGYTSPALATQTYEPHFTDEQLMQRAVELAERNARSKKGGPFGAVISNEKGKILGEGTNGITSRVDPTAHAEIMAIRQAAEKLGRSDLSDCTLYCSSEPTMMGHALISSVGIKKVFFGLSHKEINKIRSQDAKVRAELEGHKPKETEYIQLGHDHAMTVFERWEALEEKLAD
ncbi:MAG: response regulator [Alphaproteobacteria bacterium]|nr:response regulator [Alphaproteobacteria bacterium]